MICRNIFFRRMIAFLPFLLLVSCGPKSIQDIQRELAEEAAERGGVKISEVRTNAPSFEVRKIKIGRKEFEESFGSSSGAPSGSTSFQTTRVIQIFERREQGWGYPEYRIFGVHGNSPFGMLGLQTGDVIVAANDHILFSAITFKKYIQLLKSEEAAQIEIRRAGKPMLFEYTFVE